MDARALEDALAIWHGIRLPEPLNEAVARQAVHYARITRVAAAGLAFDDEPAHFARVRAVAPAGRR